MQTIKGKYLKRNLIAILIFASITLQIIPVFLYQNKIVPVNRLEVVPSKIRSGITPEFENLGGSPSHPYDFLNLILPYGFRQYFLHVFGKIRSEEDIMYIGIIGIILAFAGIFSRGRDKYKWAFLAEGIIMFLIMLGRRTPLMWLSYHFFPGFSIIRHTELFAPFFMLILCYFVGSGMEVILERIGDNAFLKRLQNILIYIITACILGFGGIYFYNISSREKFSMGAVKTLTSSALHMLIFLALMVVFLKLLRNKHRLNLKFLLLFLILSCDLAFVGTHLMKFTAREKGNLIVPEEPTPYSYSAHRARYARVNPQAEISWYLPALYKIFTAYPSGHVLGTRIFELNDFYTFYRSRISHVTKDIIAGVTSPKLRLVDKAVILDHQDILNFLERIKPEILKDLVVIEEQLPLAYKSMVLEREEVVDDLSSFNSSREDNFKIIYFDANRLVIETKTDVPSFLYYSDGFDEHWQGFVDEKPAKIYKTNFAFKSVIVDKGYHIVEFTYNPKLYKFSLILFSFMAVSFFIYIIWALFGTSFLKANFLRMKE